VEKLFAEVNVAFVLMELLHFRIEIKIMKATYDNSQLIYCTIHYKEINKICTLPVTIQHSGTIN
jgi:hypothetical protein